MNRAKLWTIITEKNPEFLTGNVTLTPSGLRKLFETAWDQGHKQGVANGIVIGRATERKANDSVFGRIFG